MIGAIAFSGRERAAYGSTGLPFRSSARAPQGISPLYVRVEVSLAARRRAVGAYGERQAVEMPLPVSARPAAYAAQLPSFTLRRLSAEAVLRCAAI